MLSRQINRRCLWRNCSGCKDASLHVMKLQFILLHSNNFLLWLDLCASLIRLNTHTAVKQNLIQRRPFCCPKYSLEHQMWNNIPMHKCTISLCLNNIWYKIQWTAETTEPFLKSTSMFVQIYSLNEPGAKSQRKGREIWKHWDTDHIFLFEVLLKWN